MGGTSAVREEPGSRSREVGLASGSAWQRLKKWSPLASGQSKQRSSLPPAKTQNSDFEGQQTDTKTAHGGWQKSDDRALESVGKHYGVTQDLFGRGRFSNTSHKRTYGPPGSTWLFRDCAIEDAASGLRPQGLSFVYYNATNNLWLRRWLRKGFCFPLSRCVTLPRGTYLLVEPDVRP